MKRMICLFAAMVLLVLSSVSASSLVNGIFLGSDENGVNILNDLLRPGEEYHFPVLIAVDGTPPVNLTSADLSRSRLTVRVSKGAGVIDEVSIEEVGGLVYVRLIPGGDGTINRLESTLRLNYSSPDQSQNLTVLPVIKVGYTVMSDDIITALDPGEFFEPDNLNPIIMPTQWNELTRINDYREVTLSGSDWRYSVNVTNLGKRNMVSAHRPDMELIRKLPQHQLHFVGFPGAPDFEVPGKLTLDVSSIAEEYNHDFFLYRSAYGKLYPLKHEYDRDAGEISFRPSQLSSYVISDRRISLSDNSPDSSSRPDDSEATPPAENPNTGGGSSGIVARIVALVSLAGLGIMGCSKRHI